jgi:hypothetical protein
VEGALFTQSDFLRKALHGSAMLLSQIIAMPAAAVMGLRHHVAPGVAKLNKPEGVAQRERFFDVPQTR